MKILHTLIFIAFAFGLFTIPMNSFGQCCAGGSGCTIVGNVAQGVLQEREFEISSNFQFIYSNTFYKEDKPASYAERTFDSFQSSYQYLKIGYGLSEHFTFSLETGYYFQKKETGLAEDPLTTYANQGFGDLLLFPKYNIVNQFSENHHDEITLGLGYKIPLGAYNDSTGNVEPFSEQIYYVTDPTAVQLSSGSQDIVFHTLLSRRYIKSQFSVFATSYYIHKGYNPNGEKLGDYFSIAMFASKTIFEQIGLGVQLRYEQVERMKINESVFLYGRPSNYYPEATGYKKVFITPQISMTRGNFSIYGSYDLPVYQYLNTSPYYTQAASEFQATIGLSYRFFVKQVAEPAIEMSYQCPMHPEISDTLPSICSKCGMLLVRKE